METTIKIKIDEQVNYLGSGKLCFDIPNWLHKECINIDTFSGKVLIEKNLYHFTLNPSFADGDIECVQGEYCQKEAFLVKQLAVAHLISLI